jgi:hypothetical protein
MAPDIVVRTLVFCAVAAAAVSRFSLLRSMFGDEEAVGFSLAMTLRMLVPISTRSPSFNVARLIFSPLTKVPLVEPRSSISIWSVSQKMRA